MNFDEILHNSTPLYEEELIKFRARSDAFLAPWLTLIMK